MTFSIEKMKRERELNKANLLSQLTKKDTKSSGKNENVWKPTLDKEKRVGTARVRFLPDPSNEKCYRDVVRHAFQGPTGAWYINVSPKTLDAKAACPVTELRNRLFNTKNKIDEDFAKTIKPQKKVYANVLILDDPAAPENNGQVKLWEFGPIILKFIAESLTPAFEGEPSIDPFDLWSGRDFVFKATIGNKKNDQWDFTRSHWYDSVTELYPDDDDKKEKLLRKCHKLSDIVSPSEIKTYEQLKAQLASVLVDQYVGSGVPVVVGGQSVAPVLNESTGTERPSGKPSVDVKSTPKPPEDIDIEDFLNS